MSLKILHLTLPGGKLVAVRAAALKAIQENPPAGGGNRTLLVLGCSEDSDVMVTEPYETVLRMWADALSE